jgi:predicted GNAT family acetyltransferase
MRNMVQELVYDDTESGGCFTLTVDGVRVGKATFVWVSENMVNLDHTLVLREHEGRGYGRLLVEAVLEMAEARGLIVIPGCSYARHVMETR